MARGPSIGQRLLIGAAVLLALLWLPFDLLFGWIGRLLPGAQKQAKHEASDSEKAQALIAALAPGCPEIVIAPDAGDPWNDAINALCVAARLGVIDWRSEPDELRGALDPMLARQGAALDWAFLDELERRGDWNAIRNERLIPRVGKEIAKLGLVLAHVDEGSDAYMMAVCTPSEFARIDDIVIGNDGVRIRRFA